MSPFSKVVRKFTNVGLAKASIYLFLLFCSFTTVQVSAQSYLINGVSEYTEFNEPVYAVKLELTRVRDNSQQIYNHQATKKLSFRLLAERSPRLWSRMFIQNLSMNNDVDMITTQSEDLIKMAQAIKGNLVPGDLIEIERLDDNLTVMAINRVDVATFETEGYFEFVLSGFIGETPPTIEMKDELLANGEYDPNILSLFDSISYSLTRISDINDWGPDLEIERPTETNQASSNQQPRGGQQAMGGGGQQARGGGAMGGSGMGAPAMGGQSQARGGGQQQARGAGGGNQQARGGGQGRGQQGRGGAMGAPQQQPDLQAAMSQQFAQLTPESLIATQKYQKDALERVNASLVYPVEAQSRGIEADVRIAVQINERGEVMATETLQGAQNRPDFERFERAAINAVFDAAPFNTIPDSIADRPFVVDLNIAFRAGNVASRNSR